MSVCVRVFMLCAQAEAAQLRRTAANISKEIRGFWGKINKLVTYKQKLESDEIRQKVRCTFT